MCYTANFCNCNIEVLTHEQSNHGHRSENEEMVCVERKIFLNMCRELDILRGKGETTPVHSTISASVHIMCNP